MSILNRWQVVATLLAFFQFFSVSSPAFAGGRGDLIDWLIDRAIELRRSLHSDTPTKIVRLAPRAEMPNWHWAAAVQTSLKIIGVEITQWEIVRTVKGGIRDEGASPGEILNALSFHRLDGRVTRGLLIDQGEVPDRLDRGLPVILRIGVELLGGEHRLIITRVFDGQSGHVFDPGGPGQQIQDMVEWDEVVDLTFEFYSVDLN